ncbi:glycosyltransferase [Streptomyces polyrhachis]|uniref:Glycosyltransferase n=1 Tax=Streptomyces polyrhachis TaxID=1282885 RepID=A0ABW2GL68_9ACTN
MSRLLFVVPPLDGHVYPLAAVAAALEEHGHQIAWAGDPVVVARTVGSKATTFPCTADSDADSDSDSDSAALPGAEPDPGSGPASAELRGTAALKHRWEHYWAPLATTMAPGLTAAVLEFGPDLLVTDQQTLAGSLVAERLAVPYVTVSSTAAPTSGALLGMPELDEWNGRLLDRLRQRLGDASALYDPRFSPRGTLVLSTPELTGPQPAGRGPLRFLGPALGPRPEPAGFPRDWLDRADPRGLVLITLGFGSPPPADAFLQQAVQAVRRRAHRLRAVVVDPGGVLGEPAADADVLVVPEIPQLRILALAEAVICHGGHHTVAEALWYGVPLVLAPMRGDQPVVAGQAVATGAAVRVRFGRTDADRIGHALDSVLMEPGYAAAARRVRDSFRTAGGALAAADHLEELVLEVEEGPWT